MKINEAKTLKKDTEKAIFAILGEFKMATGLTVESVDLEVYISRDLSGYSEKIFHGVKLKVELK